ncbi:MAG TPA: hypothetical protein VJ899_03420 [Salegentibacter sp.]|nr:hypothetical protein [Salegentibacter sp.]
MIRNYDLQKKAILFVAPMFLLLLASCGSYQYSGYEDGIYGDSEQRQSTEEPSQYANNNQDQGNVYYKNLFAEKSQFYGQMADNIVFTDVESYSSAAGGEEEIYYEDQQGYNTGRAPWGEDPDQYTVNIYNTGWNGGFFNPWAWNSFGFGNFFYNDLWWDPFYGPWGGGFGPWGFAGYSPWRGGFLGPWGGGGFGPRWGNRLGFGFGGFGFGGFYNGFWGGGFANNPYYWSRNNFRDIAYNSGRRASYSDYSSNRRENMAGIRNNESSYSRSIRAIRSNRNSERSYTRSNSNVYSRSNRRSEPARVNTSSTRRNSSINRSNRSSRSNSTYNRSSNRSSRSSGSVRRSSSSSRSSGSRSSGGGRSSSSRGGGRG